MTADDCFPMRLVIPAVNGLDGKVYPSIEVDITWHMCCDYAVMAPLTAWGESTAGAHASSVAGNGDRMRPATDRSSSLEQRAWAGQHVRPFIEAKKKVSTSASSSFVQVYVTCSPYVSGMSCDR
jgi:predicted aconitase